MPTRLTNVVVDAADMPALARFWSEALGWPVAGEESDEVWLDAPAEQAPEPGFGLVFESVDDPKTTKNRLHLDLASSSLDDQDATVHRLLELGAQPLDVGQGDVPWVVLADPEGNELCVLEPRARYAGTGALAAIVVDCHDARSLAPFWEAAAGWPVAGMSDTSMSFRAPSERGPFLELLAVPGEKVVKNRVHLDVAPFADDDQAAEVHRLVALGARRVDIGQGDVTWDVLADPEGNELCVLSRR
ncbi:MAG: VOC family protein [Acidimicrobiales bacterium]